MTGPAAHILFVDDREDSRYATAKLLEHAGYQVTAAPDYRKALELLDSEAPCDLLITDVVMPERVNGFALARMARMRRQGLRVLYITAYDVPSSEADGKVLLRPIADQDLLKEIEASLAA